MNKFLIGFVALLALFLISNPVFSDSQAAFNSRAISNTAVPTQEKTGINSAAKASPQVERFLSQTFCSPQICGTGSWQQWIIVAPNGDWEVGELEMLRDLVTAVIEALEQQGLDGRTLLNGYRFRRQHGEFIADNLGHVAVVNHTSQEITLADAAFKRLHGFYIIHELGHVVDYRSGRQLTANFHALAGSDLQAQQTAANYWLNLPARDDLEEATADGFALWIMSTFTASYRPAFAYTPQTTNYAGITTAMAASIEELSVP